jgi:hypothetical protein
MDLQGENGEVSFIDLTETPLDFTLDKADGPVTTHSIFRIRVSEPNLVLSDFTTSDEGVLSLTEIRPIYGDEGEGSLAVATELVTQVGVAGTARLTVTLADGRSDFIDVRAVAPTSSRISFFPYFGLMTLNSEMYEAGIALVDGGEFQLFGAALDEGGHNMMGAGGLPWNTTGTGLTLVDHNAENDFVRVKSTGELGTGTVAFGDSEPTEIETVDASAVQSIRIIRDKFTADPASVGGAIYLHVALFTEDGRLVVGELGEAATFVLEEGVSVSETWTDEASQDAHRLMLGDLMADDRNTVLTGLTPGQYTVKAQWKDLEHEITIEIQSDTAPEGSEG